MKVENRFRRGVHLLSQRLEHLLRTTIEAGHQAILLLNRRGYSNFVYCSSCMNAVQCKYCDATMTYHRTPGQHVGTARTPRESTPASSIATTAWPSIRCRINARIAARSSASSDSAPSAWKKSWPANSPT